MRNNLIIIAFATLAVAISAWVFAPAQASFCVSTIEREVVEKTSEVKVLAEDEVCRIDQRGLASYLLLNRLASHKVR